MNLYLVRNAIDGTMYVGRTIKTIASRWERHKHDAGHGSPTHLHRAIRKYGTDNFVVDPIVLVDQDFTDERSLNDGERLMIRLLRINCRLYNLTDGGDGLSNPSPELRKKLSEAHLGHPVSQKTRRKLRLASSNMSADVRHRIGLANSKSQIGNTNARRTHCKYGHERPITSLGENCPECYPTGFVPKTHCKRGHERTPDNVGKSRDCLACHACPN